MRHSYLLVGITSGKLSRLLARNGFSFKPKTLFRILFLTQSAVWASLFKLTEKRKFRKKLDGYQMPDDPVFIIGHWRTGSTFLHQLMSLDGNLVTPNVFQVSVPDSFLSSEKFYRPIMTTMIHPKRPMDNVALGFYEPQEDEYALLKLDLHSPLEKILFSKSKPYFLLEYDDFIPAENSREKWKAGLDNFCKRLSFKDGKRVMLKNPFHSMRIPLLNEIYPNAKFIHIHRHPYNVVPSTINMWKIVNRDNKLKGEPVEPGIKEVAVFLDRMLVNIKQNLAKLPGNSSCEISYETFEKDPFNSLKEIYKKLDLTYSDGFEEKVLGKLANLEDFKKNIFQLTMAEKDTIKNELEKHFIYYNYKV